MAIVAASAAVTAQEVGNGQSRTAASSDAVPRPAGRRLSAAEAVRYWNAQHIRSDILVELRHIVVCRYHGAGPRQSYFDPLAFAPVTEVRFGTAGYYTLRGSGTTNLDFSLFRSTRVRDRLVAQIRAFNPA